ncbi:hypothetical protein CAC42_6157 [Sphaceloma murrayae]|uniref:Uncharacterized protein n=1 Tax=Sphaceloma murrayae TaxID=2082308 RepID=A0A2K1QTS4_9PEZI|nr:hypothetical protein CAC42_6157 [Sphaceloma murrayae]
MVTIVVRVLIKIDPKAGVLEVVLIAARDDIALDMAAENIDTPILVLIETLVVGEDPLVVSVANGIPDIDTVLEIPVGAVTDTVPEGLAMPWTVVTYIVVPVGCDEVTVETKEVLDPEV